MNMMNSISLKDKTDDEAYMNSLVEGEDLKIVVSKWCLCQKMPAVF